LSKLDSILQIIQLTLSGLSGLPVVGPFAQIGGVLEGIFEHAATLYEAETGQPFDASKIPIETDLSPEVMAMVNARQAAAGSSSPAPGGNVVTITKGPEARPAAKAAAAAATPAGDSRCPFCGAAGTATGAACVACGRVHQ
jgi:hypothetical protein